MSSEPAANPSTPQPNLRGLELRRFAVEPAGAFGVLTEAGAFIAFTLERTYPLAGTAQLVKIPCGLWRCVRNTFRRGGYETFEVVGVPGHSRLLFHRGNVEADSEGCILLGLEPGTLNGVPAVLRSREAHDRFMARLAGEVGFSLRVTEWP